MEFLQPEQILEQKTLIWEPLEVPEWESSGARWVRVKMLSAREQDEFEASMMTVDKQGRPLDQRSNARARLVQLALIKDERGTPMFTKHDIKVLGELPAAGLQRVFNKVNEMSKLTEEDLESIGVNFKDAPEESSPSD